MSTPETPRTVYIARCPEHGLHGERTECFVCKGPVEQVPMVAAGPVDVERERLLDLLGELLRLKNGPRDEAYHVAKDAAWKRTRTVLREYGRLGKEES